MTAPVEEFPVLVLDDDLAADEAVSLLIEQCVDMRVSDLFLAMDEDSVAVKVRHLGIVRPLGEVSRELGQRCIGHVRAQAGMDIVERRRPLDGRWLYTLKNGQRIDLRISIIPTLHGEDLSIRLLSRDMRLLGLEGLGMIRKEVNDLVAMLNAPSGLILVAGPTGSGKTATLYACLGYLNNGKRKTNTIEDPIEYELKGVRQSQVNPKIDLGFADMLRSVLRQAPDVIMIGEIRDAETAATAVHAANSGHLVLATVHAPAASAAVQTMASWGVNPHFLGSSLLGVIAQRLIRTLCPKCRTPYGLAEVPFLFDEIKHLLPEGEGQTLWSARGCAHCHGTGYRNRTGVFEVLRVTTAMRRLIAGSQPAQILREEALREGLIELRQAALLKVAQGQTTAEEVVRAVPAEFLGSNEKPA